MDGKHRLKNISSFLLSEEENEIIFRLLGTGCQTLSTTVVQLLSTTTSHHKKWQIMCKGVVCLVRDLKKRSHFIRVYDLDNREQVWEQELFHTIVFKTPKTDFHIIEDQEVFGLNFADESEAKHFGNTVNDILMKQMARIEYFFGWNRKTNRCDVERVDKRMIAFLESADISGQVLKDDMTRDFIFDFIEKNGGCERAISEGTKLSSTASPPKPPDDEYPGSSTAYNPGFEERKKSPLKPKRRAPPPPPPPPPVRPPRKGKTTRPPIPPHLPSSPQPPDRPPRRDKTTRPPISPHLPSSPQSPVRPPRRDKTTRPPISSPESSSSQTPVRPPRRDKTTRPPTSSPLPSGAQSPTQSPMTEIRSPPLSGSGIPPPPPLPPMPKTSGPSFQAITSDQINDPKLKKVYTNAPKKSSGADTPSLAQILGAKNALKPTTHRKSIYKAPVDNSKLMMDTMGARREHMTISEEDEEYGNPLEGSESPQKPLRKPVLTPQKKTGDWDQLMSGIKNGQKNLRPAMDRQLKPKPKAEPTILDAIVQKAEEFHKRSEKRDHDNQYKTEEQEW